MSKIDTNELDEGALYVLKKGILTEVATDPDDTMKRVKITEDAFQAVSALQSSLRKAMSGYRPDIHTVCSALIKHAAQQPNGIELVQTFILEMYQNIGKAN